MDPENNNKTPSEDNNVEGSVSISQVTSVATGWMLDFMFVSLCHRFKEGRLNEFNETLSTFQAVSQSPFIKGKRNNEKAMICAFLARVMHGKQMDVLFEEDDSVMPLMSAAKIWPKLEHTVADDSLFNNIDKLLLVQSVAVCLEEGQRSSASSALKWFMNNHKLPQNLEVRLSTIVTQKETYHPFLMSFSFSRLLETIQSYLDAYLERNPSDYLLKAATKVVQSSPNSEGLEDVESRDNTLSKTANESTEIDRKRKKSAACLRAKRKLLSTKITDVWRPDTCKKAYVPVRRISENEISQMTLEKSPGSLKVHKKRKPHQKWPFELDRHLMAGVNRHGEGRWSRILLDYDFEGRTGTMLKDRWRVLKKADKVC